MRAVTFVLGWALGLAAAHAAPPMTTPPDARAQAQALERIPEANRSQAQRVALGRAYHQSGRLKEARAQAEAVLAQHPNDVEALLIRGDVHREYGAWDAAAADFTRAAQLVPNRAEVHLRLGQALMAQGKTQEADAAFARYRSLSQRGQ